MKLIILFILILIILYAVNQFKGYNLDEIKDMIINSAKQNNLDIVNIFEENNKGYTEKKEEISSVFKKLSASDKVTLENVTEKWSFTKDTMESELEGKLIFTVRRLLSHIHKLTEKDFYIKNIENVYVMKDNENNYRAVLNCFIHNIKDYNTIKLMFDFVSINNIMYINYIDIDESGIKTLINKYDTKWKSSGILVNYNMFDSDIINTIDQYYKKKYKLVQYNSENVYDPELDNGITLDDLSNDIIPLEPDKDSHISPLFCDKTSYEWNNLSLFKQSDEDCLINKQSVEAYPNYPFFHVPGSITNNVDENMYDWLKNPNEKV